MRTETFDDGIAFINAEGKEFAFYSYITGYVCFYQGKHSGWTEVDCSVITVDELLFVTNIVKIEKKKQDEQETGLQDSP